MLECVELINNNAESLENLGHCFEPVLKISCKGLLDKNPHNFTQSVAKCQNFGCATHCDNWKLLY